MGGGRLPRQKLSLVAPPFVHAHEQATQQGPKILEVRLFTQEKEMVIDNEGTRLQAMTFNVRSRDRRSWCMRATMSK